MNYTSKYMTRGKADYIWGLLRNRCPELKLGDINILQCGANVYTVTFRVPDLQSKTAEILNAIKLTENVDWSVFPTEYRKEVEVVIR
jgi:hypothetical protein